MNRLSALGESVSFGRFLSESLDWGKWSSFNHNKYLEEAERYSRPGVVAQKKAYFEAHYKRIASLKKAESKEQESNCSFNTNATDMSSSDVKAESEEPNCKEATAEVQNREFETNNCDLSEETSPITPDDNHIDSSLLISSSDVIETGQDKNKISQVEAQRSCISEKEPLKESLVTNQENEEKRRVPKPISALHGSSKLSSSPGTKSSPARKIPSLYCVKENSSRSPRSRTREMSFNEKKRSTSKAMHMSMNFRHDQVGVANPSRIKNSSQEQLDQFKTPIRVRSSKGIRTPQSAKERIITLSELTPAERTQSAKVHNFSVDYSKSVGTKGRRSCSTVSASPLRLKIDEREDKGEKEKDENELREFRKSLCFKARPLPDFYRKIESTKDANKKKCRKDLKLITGDQKNRNRMTERSENATITLKFFTKLNLDIMLQENYSAFFLMVAVTSAQPPSPIAGRCSYYSKASLDHSPIPPLKPFYKSVRSTTQTTKKYHVTPPNYRKETIKDHKQI